MKRSLLFLFLAFLAILLVSCNSPENNSTLTVASGRVERLENFPSQYIEARNVDIWLPEGYPETGPYAVLYMHDGQMLFDSSITWNKQEWGVDEVLGNLIKEGKVRKTIVVGVWNGGDTRHADYFPQKPFEALPLPTQDSILNHARRDRQTLIFPIPLRSDDYLRFLVQELKPYVDEHYATLPGMENTFIAGSSMGGLISLYALCEYPEVFAGAACISTHWIGIFREKDNPIPAKFMEYMTNHLPDPETHRIYFDYGTETLDAFYEPFQRQADSVMIEKGFREDSWMTRKFPGDDHSEQSWTRRLHIPLNFLLEKKE
jgi:enterochelin esterase-like enzyme